MPGIGFPCINSTLAPPPVDMKEIWSARPKLFTRFTESPPPTIEVAPYFVLYAIFLNRYSLPTRNSGISNTPKGPFQKIDLALFMT
jgi:hypothetical protein